MEQLQIGPWAHPLPASQGDGVLPRRHPRLGPNRQARVQGHEAGNAQHAAHGGADSQCPELHDVHTCGVSRTSTPQAALRCTRHACVAQMACCNRA